MKAKTFDDVLLVPQYSEVDSRHSLDLSGNRLSLAVPFISANMDTITEESMAIAMHEQGGMGIIHRFLDTDRLAQIITRCKQNRAPVCVSIGINESRKEHIEVALSKGVKMFCVDVAHGHHKGVWDTIRSLRKRTDFDPEIIIIAGNVATPEGAEFLAEAGANIVKVGVGPGSVCTTRIKTGHGVPQITALENIKQHMIGNYSDVELIADGGIRNGGDIAKAIAAGADYVMIGSLLAGTDETPGDIVTDGQGHKVKMYRGMASLSAQLDMGRGKEKIIEEGAISYKRCRGPMNYVIRDLKLGLCSAFSYSGSSNMKQFKSKAKLIEITTASYIEGTPHGA